MRGSAGRFAPGVRVGDYVLEHALPSRATEVAFAGSHVVLPRRARIVTPAVPSEAAARQLLREAYILEAVRHAAVPRVFECGRTDRPWIAVELVDGETVAELTAERPLAIADVVALLRDCSAILEHAHARGIAHRGIGPTAIVRNTAGHSIVEWDSAVADISCGQPTDDVRALGAVAAPAARRGLGAPARLTALVERMLAGTPTMADVRVETGFVADELAAPIVLDDGMAIEEVSVVLVDISRDPPPIPRPSKVKWTPPDAYVARITPDASGDRKKAP